MLHWAIVGGGVHGTLLSRVLLEEAGVAPDRLAVLDPHREPLAGFWRCAAATGMEFMRSSVVHHLDREPMSLQRFAQRHGDVQRHLKGPYLRPSIEIFAEHCRHVIERQGLDRVRRQGEVEAVVRIPGGLRLETGAGALDARRVVLAVGSTGRLDWPSWASELRRAGAPISHLFEADFTREGLGDWRRLVVVGGGLSALQAAMSLARGKPGAVTLLSRHEPRVHDFDTDSGWMGPKLGRRFSRMQDRQRRRDLIVRARHRGSAPAETAGRVARCVASGEMQLRLGEVSAGHVAEPGWVTLKVGEDELEADRVVLATGFDSGRPGGEWLDRTIARLGLQYAGCGYPVVDRDLRWSPQLFVTGPLAELEIGPLARNIHGARLAGQRLLRVAAD
jgi:cation diffusion facilitator CzcD-associated flavoprotein CzcO